MNNTISNSRRLVLEKGAAPFDKLRVTQVL